MPTYGEVKTEFSALLNRRDATSTQITTFLQNSIRRIQRTLRVPAMEKSAAITITDAYVGLAIPSDYLELIRITDPDGIELDRRDFTTVMAHAATSGAGYSRMFARRGVYWLLGPTPAEDEVYRVDYFAEADEVADDEDENTFTLIAPDLIIYGALSYACRHFNDKRFAEFNATYNNIHDEITMQADRDDLSGGSRVSPAYPFPYEEV